MSNTSKGWGRKGSKFWMQMVACFPKLEKEFIYAIELEKNGSANNLADFEWISPCAKDNLEEYTLNSSVVESRLGIPGGFWKTWKNCEMPFWTHRQPQWDAIAFCNSTKTLYLIEAKAHI